MKNICVFCGSADGILADFRLAARQTGNILAESGFGLVYGGGKTGLMGDVADGVLEAGGEVIGVIVESMMRTSYPARRSGVDTARIPKGAVASRLENAGKKKTIFFLPAIW